MLQVLLWLQYSPGLWGGVGMARLGLSVCLKHLMKNYNNSIMSSVPCPKDWMRFRFLYRPVLIEIDIYWFSFSLSI